VAQKPSNSENPLHYDLLAEYHEAALKASKELERSLRVRDDAQKRIDQARKSLASAQGLISDWYLEKAPAPVSDKIQRLINSEEC
jgi:hypothetical protein